jgi:hypothetical protein
MIAFAIAAAIRVPPRPHPGTFWRVDQRDDRETELAGVVREAQRLAVALGCIIPSSWPPFPSGSVLLMAENICSPVLGTDTGDQRRIVCGEPVAGFDEVGSSRRM